MQLIVNKEGKVYELSGLKINETANQYVEKGIKGLSFKEQRMKAKSLVLVYKKTNRVIFELNIIHNQHYYPLSILDYANSMLEYMKHNISNLPIMSLDSHDYNFCDFHCKDCLAVDTRNWAKDNLGFTNFDINHYKKVIKELLS